MKICFMADATGFIGADAMAPTKIKNELGDELEMCFAEGVLMTTCWNLKHQDRIREVTSGDYQ